MDGKLYTKIQPEVKACDVWQILGRWFLHWKIAKYNLTDCVGGFTPNYSCTQN